jgi:hypothetical protein
MSSLDPTNRLCVGRAQDPLGGGVREALGALGGGVGHANVQK